MTSESIQLSMIRGGPRSSGVEPVFADQARSLETGLYAVRLDMNRGFRPIQVVPKHILRKEVIQPQVPLRLPCYDFTPVTTHSLGACLPCGLAQPLLEQATPMV